MPFPFPEILSRMDKLPAELLERVFIYLPYEERKTGVLINSKWRKAGEAANLWTWVLLPRVEEQWSCNRVIEMLNSPRLARAEEIAIKAEPVSDDLLQAVILHKGLKQIEMWGSKLPARVDTQLVVEALTRVDSLDLQAGSLPSQVFIALLTKVTAGCSLKELYLHADTKEKTLSKAWRAALAPRYSIAAKTVPQDILASAFSRLTIVHLTHTRLTNSQVGALMEGINQSDSSLKDFSLIGSLYCNRTGHLDLKPLVNVEKVQLHDNFLTWNEICGFFAAVSPVTKLRKLDLEDSPRGNGPEKEEEEEEEKEESDGSKEMMAKAINFLEEAQILIDHFEVNCQTFFNEKFRHKKLNCSEFLRYCHTGILSIISFCIYSSPKLIVNQISDQSYPETEPQVLKASAS